MQAHLQHQEHCTLVVHSIPQAHRTSAFGQRRARLIRQTKPTQQTSCRHSQQLSCAALASEGAVSTERKPAPAEDKWIAKLLAANSPSADSSPPLSALRERCTEALRTQRMPTTRNESYRYTDISMLLKTEPQPSTSSSQVTADAVSALPLDEANGMRIVVVDGRIAEELSDLSAVPEGVFMGPLAQAPSSAADLLGDLSGREGGPFATLNGATARDVVCVVVAPGVKVEQPLHVLYLATGTSGVVAASSPRLLVAVASGGSLEIVEEFTAAPAVASSGERYFTNAVAEMVLEDGAELKHAYVGMEDEQAWHFKATLVRQGAGSRYALVEAALGGSLARHDLRVSQAGPDTATVLRSFLLCGAAQLHDLHSHLQLEHPGGTADQLHKCIVTQGSGRGVFDGGVTVARLAQKTDAAQLSRNLLLVPKATVNVKPNLQIVADDVKCTHGCTVSDLEDEQLFYFLSRGIDQAAARQTLVYSFGAEVTRGLAYPQLQQRVQAAVSASLAEADI